MDIFLIALDITVQQNTLQRTVGGLKSNEKSTLKASGSVFGVINRPVVAGAVLQNTFVII